MTCDNGNTFTARLWQDIHNQLNTIVSYTPIYSPSSLGSLERQHGDIKSSLRAVLHTMGEQHQSNWMRILPWVILSRRTSFHGELGATPAQAVYGEDMKLPGDLIPPMGSGETIEDLLQRVQANADRPPAQTATHKQMPVYMPAATETCTHVWTKRAKPTPLGVKWDGPFEIDQRLGKSCLKLKVGEYKNGQFRTEIRHWKSCYPADMPEGSQGAYRPALGRPKST